MKVLKTILIILLVLIVAYLILCFIGPKNVDTTRYTTMNAPAGVVYDQINDIKKWESWSPWNKADTTMKVSYGDKTVGVGANYSWTSSSQGNGNFEILESSPDSMKTKMSFEGWDGYSYGTWIFEEVDEGTKVTWGMNSDRDMPLMFRGFALVAGMKGKLKQNFDDGLASIKDYTEAIVKKIKAVTVNSVDLPEKNYVVNRNKIAIDGLSKYYADNFPTMFGAVGASGAEISGMPSSIFYDWNPSEGITDVGAAIPVASPTVLEGYESVTFPAGKALVVDHFGPYHTVGSSHWAIDAYMKDNNLEYKGPAIEEYVNDPTTVTEDKIQTKITYYIN